MDVYRGVLIVCAYRWGTVSNFTLVEIDQFTLTAGSAEESEVIRHHPYARIDDFAQVAIWSFTCSPLVHVGFPLDSLVSSHKHASIFLGYNPDLLSRINSLLNSEESIQEFCKRKRFKF